MSETTIIKQLPKPWKIAGQEVTEIEVREPTVGDLVEAEKEAHPSTNPHAFNVALACQTLVRAGTHAGPFAPGQFKSMGARTWGVIRQAMQEADDLGEGEQPETTPSV